MAARVAFTAVANHGGNLGPNQADTTVVFNTIITTVGEGYDNTSGDFTAPVAGLYYFTFSYHVETQNKSGLSLMKNSSNLIVKALDNNDKGERFTDNAGNSAFLVLKKGEQVCVRLPADCQVWAADNATSFSGFLVG